MKSLTEGIYGYGGSYSQLWARENVYQSGS